MRIHRPAITGSISATNLIVSGTITAEGVQVPHGTAVSSSFAQKSAVSSSFAQKSAVSSSFAQKTAISGSINASAISGAAAITAIAGTAANQILTDDGDATVTSESGLTYDGSTLAVTGDQTLSGDLDMEDDKGIIFGTGDDYWFGAQAGEDYLAQYVGGTQGQGGTEGQILFATKTDDSTNMYLDAGIDNRAKLFLRADQSTDASDRWSIEAEDGNSLYFNVGSNTADETIRFSDGGTAQNDEAWDDNTWDYAELFEWETHLATDDTIKDLYGQSVVLSGSKVAIAEAGDEDKILGVVRPKGTTASHGDGLKWQKKYIKNVWGEYEMENYTQVTWQEFLPNGNASYFHSYPKDEIPPYRLKNLGNVGRDKNNHLTGSNFELDKTGNPIPVVIPTGSQAEMTASNYTERTTHRSTGETLMRRKYHPDYDPSIPYIRRADRLKEWVLIGLLGQVPVRDTAVIPDHWVKMKNLGSGIDKYYIFNK